MKLFISTEFSPKMFIRYSKKIMEEINIDCFKKYIIQYGSKYDIIFSSKDKENIYKLLKLLNIENIDIYTKNINSEEINVNDIILLALATNSCIFRYFIFKEYL